MSEMSQDRKTQSRSVPRDIPENLDDEQFVDDVLTFTRLAELLFSDDDTFATYLHFLPEVSGETPISSEDIETLYRNGPRALSPERAKLLLTGDPGALALLREKLHNLSTELPQPWSQEMVRLIKTSFNKKFPSTT